MSAEFGNLGSSGEEGGARNTTLIIIAVVVLVLLCCCCASLVLAWNYGDTVIDTLEQLGLIAVSV